MPSFKASDGVELWYRCTGSGPALILLHGWSGSHRSFDLNVEALSQRCTVVTPDLRFHGNSGKPSWGFHVARLASDLLDLITACGLERPAVCGCSLGAAIIWSFVELFGPDPLGKVCFVDQAPSQWRMPDWPHCSKGIYDDETVGRISDALHAGLADFADGNAACCLTARVDAALLETLKAETQKCEPAHLAALMADHARLDWRPVLPRVTLPALNLYGTESGCFPPEGCAAVGDLVPNCRSEAFEGCNHWLYMEEPEKFNKLLGDFASRKAAMPMPMPPMPT